MDGQHILFVDDDRQLVGLGKTILNRHGYRVTTHICPAEAFEIFKKDPDLFDLLISDNIMPKMSGLDLIAKVLAIRPTIPIILCSGYTEEADIIKARELGINKFIPKPLSKPILIAAVVETLSDGE